MNNVGFLEWGVPFWVSPFFLFIFVRSYGRYFYVTISNALELDIEQWTSMIQNYQIFGLS
jgi:hypothetical protein